MLIESVPGEPLSFHVIPFDNPRLQTTLQVRSHFMYTIVWICLSPLEREKTDLNLLRGGHSTHFLSCEMRNGVVIMFLFAFLIILCRKSAGHRALKKYGTCIIHIITPSLMS